MILLIIFIAYQLLQIIALPLVVLLLAFLHIKRSILGNIAQRCGLLPKTPLDKHVVWIHAVSVGETLTTQELINRIKSQTPHAFCYLTVGTTSAHRIAREQIKADQISFLPYDFLPCMLLAYARIKPKSVILIESELWPNLISLAHYKKIPLFLMNARVRKQSNMRMFPVSYFFATLLNCFSMIFAQSHDDQDAFEKIGVKASKLVTLGNLKAYNVIAKKNELIEHQPLPIPYQSSVRTILVGSIHPTEDQIYLNLFSTLKKEMPNLKLVLAPRHFGWQETLVKNINQTGYRSFIWTDTNPIIQTNGQSPTEAYEHVLANYDILVICKLGELFTIYPYATVFALGGTFVPVGGHNLLEPAAWAIPTFIGPYYGNCSDIADKLEALDAIVKVQSSEQLTEKMRQLLNSPAQLKSIGGASHAWVLQEAQKLQQSLELLLEKI